MKTKTFTCENCGLTFPSDTTDEEMALEAAANGWDEDDDLGIVCDGCFNMLMGRVGNEN
jgi:hypothetical protein